MTLADVELLRAAVREAGALAHSLFRQSVEALDEERRLAGDRGRSRGGQGAQGTPHCSAARAMVGFRKKRPTTEERLARREVWIVDPIDGTRAFAQGGDDWCVAAALLVEGRPTLAAIYRPDHQGLLRSPSRRRRHAQREATPHGGYGTLAGARILGNASALKQLEAKAPVKAVAGGNTPLAMRLALVAQGDLEAALSTTPKHDWDLAAGDLLVHEAGGKRDTGLDGKKFTYQPPRDAAGELCGVIASRCMPHFWSNSQHHEQASQETSRSSFSIWCSAANSPISTVSTFKDVAQARHRRHLSEFRNWRRRRGSPRRAKPSTMLICAISSCICIACSIPRPM